MCAHLCAWLFAFVNIICRNERVKLWDFVVLIPIYVASQHSIVHTILITQWVAPEDLVITDAEEIDEGLTGREPFTRNTF